MSVQVSYKKQTAMGIFGIVILLLVIELVANVWWISQINCEFEDSEIFRDMSEDKKNQLCMDLYQIRTSGDEIIPNQSSNTININSEGFRGSEFSLIKESGHFRIMMLGGCYCDPPESLARVASPDPDNDYHPHWDTRVPASDS